MGSRQAGTRDGSAQDRLRPVSHGKKHKKRHKAKSRPFCPRCLTPSDGSPAALLEALAAALNEIHAAGIRLHFAHGAAFCQDGAVVPPVEKGQVWEARPFGRRPDALPEGGDDD